MEYFSAIKRNEQLIHMTTWMTIKIIMLNEKSQAKKEHILYDST